MHASAIMILINPRPALEHKEVAICFCSCYTSNITLVFSEVRCKECREMSKIEHNIYVHLQLYAVE